MGFADSTLQAVDVGDFIVSVVDNIEDVETHFEIRAADGSITLLFFRGCLCPQCRL